MKRLVARSATAQSLRIEGLLVVDLRSDFPLDVLQGVRADPSVDQWVEVDLGERIEITTIQRAQGQAGG